MNFFCIYHQMTIAPDTINDTHYLTDTDVICTSSAWYTISAQRVEIPCRGALLSIQVPAILGEYDVYYNNQKIGRCKPNDYGRYEMCMSRVSNWPMTSTSDKYFCLGMHCDYVSRKGTFEIEFKADHIKKIHALHTHTAVLDEHTRLSSTAGPPSAAVSLEALITLQRRNKVYHCTTPHHKGNRCYNGRLSIDSDGIGGY